MLPAVVLCLLLCLLLLKDASSQVTVFGDRAADFGGNAKYNCAMADSADVLQVTWQRLGKDKILENLASYSRRFGGQVNGPLLGKIIFTEASLHSTSITVKNLTWADECCYICTFSTYPEGSTRRQTCLTVQGISNVETSVQSHTGPDEDEDKDKDKDISIECSATGKPAPTIGWDAPSAVMVDRPRDNVVRNEDGTFTSHSLITLRPSQSWDGSLHCLLNTGKRGEQRQRINVPVSHRDPGKKDEETDVTTSPGPAPAVIATMIAALIIVGCFVGLFLMGRRRSARQRGHEKLTCGII